MRGQAQRSRRRRYNDGITPADAGTSMLGEDNVSNLEDHPRGCGDKFHLYLLWLQLKGSPPRMRGQGLRNSGISLGSRITPADAGTSFLNRMEEYGFEDHPRGCGDKPSCCMRDARMIGSPPRMRGQAQRLPHSSSGRRITPADAGTSLEARRASLEEGDHPRGCGDKTACGL